MANSEYGNLVSEGIDKTIEGLGLGHFGPLVTLKSLDPHFNEAIMIDETRIRAALREKYEGISTNELTLRVNEALAKRKEKGYTMKELTDMGISVNTIVRNVGNKGMIGFFWSINGQVAPTRIETTNGPRDFTIHNTDLYNIGEEADRDFVGDTGLLESTDPHGLTYSTYPINIPFGPQKTERSDPLYQGEIKKWKMTAKPDMPGIPTGELPPHLLGEREEEQPQVKESTEMLPEIKQKLPGARHLKKLTDKIMHVKESLAKLLVQEQRLKLGEETLEIEKERQKRILDKLKLKVPKEEDRPFDVREFLKGTARGILGKKAKTKSLSAKINKKTHIEEGFKPKPYTDTEGHLTIGTGLKISSLESDEIVLIKDKKKVDGKWVINKIDEKEDAAILEIKREKDAKVLSKKIPKFVTLDDDQHVVLMDMAHQLGRDNITSTKKEPNKFPLFYDAIRKAALAKKDSAERKKWLRIAAVHMLWNKKDGKWVSTKWHKQTEARARRNARLLSGIKEPNIKRLKARLLKDLQ